MPQAIANQSPDCKHKAGKTISPSINLQQLHKKTRLFLNEEHFKLIIGGDIDKWATDIQYVEHRYRISMFEVRPTWTNRLPGL